LKELWTCVVNQVLDKGLALGIQTDMPPQLEEHGGTEIEEVIQVEAQGESRMGTIVEVEETEEMVMN
jgi:hypothetical protein